MVAADLHVGPTVLQGVRSPMKFFISALPLTKSGDLTPKTKKRAKQSDFTFCATKESLASLNQKLSNHFALSVEENNGTGMEWN
jgi:hypothetical protein